MRQKLQNSPGEVMFTTTFELANTKTVHFRQAKSFWDILALIGGFSISTVFMGKIVYGIAKSNSSYILTQAFMMSQYQTRTRNMLVGKNKRRAMAQKALEKEKEKKRAEMNEEDKKKNKVDSEQGSSKSHKRSRSHEDNNSEENTMAEIEKEIENKELA